MAISKPNPAQRETDKVATSARKKTKKGGANPANAFLVLDETMIGFRPNTSKMGGLPNITHEPRMPVDLGTMFPLLSHVAELT